MLCDTKKISRKIRHQQFLTCQEHWFCIIIVLEKLFKNWQKKINFNDQILSFEINLLIFFNRCEFFYSFLIIGLKFFFYRIKSHDFWIYFCHTFHITLEKFPNGLTNCCVHLGGKKKKKNNRKQQFENCETILISLIYILKKSTHLFYMERSLRI